MVVAETDVTALANLVRQTGLDIEASTQELETMAVMVRKGKAVSTTELFLNYKSLETKKYPPISETTTHLN